MILDCKKPEWIWVSDQTCVHYDGGHCGGRRGTLPGCCCCCCGDGGHCCCCCGGTRPRCSSWPPRKTLRAGLMSIWPPGGRPLLPRRCHGSPGNRRPDGPHYLDRLWKQVKPGFTNYRPRVFKIKKNVTKIQRFKTFSLKILIFWFFLENYFFSNLFLPAA